MVVLGVVVLAVMLTYRKHLGIGPGAISRKYANALKVAMQFFDVQKCELIIYVNVMYPNNYM